MENNFTKMKLKEFDFETYKGKNFKVSDPNDGYNSIYFEVTENSIVNDKPYITYQFKMYDVPRGIMVGFLLSIEKYFYTDTGDYLKTYTELSYSDLDVIVFNNDPILDKTNIDELEDKLRDIDFDNIDEFAKYLFEFSKYKEVIVFDDIGNKYKVTNDTP